MWRFVFSFFHFTSCIPGSSMLKHVSALSLFHGWIIFHYSGNTKGNAKEYSNYCTIALISHASKVMLKILQARLQQYVNHKLTDVQAGFRKGRGTRDHVANIRWILKKQRVPEKYLLLLYWPCQSLWLCGSQQTGKILKRWESRPPDLPPEKPVCRSGSNS